MKHLLDIPDLDLRAFLPSAGRMRLYGKSGAPPAPDYIGQAKATSAGNLEAARAQTTANRMDQITPYGTIKYTNGQTFNQAGYDAAMAKYQEAQGAYAREMAAADNNRNNPANWGSTPGSDPGYQMTVGQGSVQSPYQMGPQSTPMAPRREDFYAGDQDKWSSEIQLSETGQQLLDQYNKTSLGLAGLQDQAMGRVREGLDQPFDTSGLIDINSQTGMDAWNKASQLIKDRNAGSLNAQQAALDAKLANQGLTAGSEGWGIQQQQFGRQRNDADMAAEMAGLQAQNQFFNQGVAGNQSTIQQRAFLRNLPLNELNALRTGSQVTNPTFNTPGQQGQTSGPDLLGASNAQYSTAVGANNAANASSAQQTQAAASLAAAGIAAYGGWAGSAAGVAAGAMF